jgi:hypothetical protein
MKLNYFFSLLKKNKIIIIVILILLILIYKIFFSNNIKEGYYTCTQLTNCSDCINTKITDTSSLCYWNDIVKKCSSWKEKGYSRTCSYIPQTPLPNIVSSNLSKIN